MRAVLAAQSAVRTFAPWWAAPFVRVAPDLSRYDAANALVRVGAPVLVLGARQDRMLQCAPAASWRNGSPMRAPT